MDSEFSSCDILESVLQYGSSGPHNLTIEYLRNITNNFSDERLLGEGGFGTVYKGVLPNGETIAVKKLRSNSSLPEVTDKQFENEVHHLMRLKHPNIVLLVGWCSETENIYVEYNGKYICAEKSERLLCLEYMQGNLHDYLSDESSGLPWETRYRIIEGICYGLHYLHGECQPNAPIIHMDLKPANILLNNNMVPKIADFGLSRLFSEGKTWTCTISRDGTLGYMAPEYINRGFISTKSDIFSLGVIIIEIVTGRRDYPDESETGISSQEFTELVLKNWSDRLQKSLRYTSLEIDYQQIRTCLRIGLDCVKLDRWKRPTISQVINVLHGTDSADFSGRKESASLKIEEMRVKSRDTNQWMPYSHLPENLKERIRHYEQYRWQETTGVDEEQFLMNLPKDLRRDIKRHLLIMRKRKISDLDLKASKDELIDFLTDFYEAYCQHGKDWKKFPMYEYMDDQLLDAMCDCLIRPILYKEGSCVIREGDPVNETLFVMRGTLMSMMTNGETTGFFNSVVLKAGDFCSEELLTWALDPTPTYTLPSSTRTVKTMSEVEAFALRAEDLNFVTTQFRRLQRKQLKPTFRYYSQQWRTWAACFIQHAWHRYCRKKIEDSLREKEKRLQFATANDSSTLLSFMAALYASRFAGNMIRILRRNASRKARLQEGVPNFSAEEQ